MGRSNPSGTMSYPKQIPVVPVKVHLNKKFSGQQSMSTEIPPNKKYKNFHYLEGVSTELQDSFENTKSNFRSPSKRTTDTGMDKSNRKISKRFLHGKKKKLYDLGKTNCLSEFYILLFYPSVPARLTDDHPNISKKKFYKTIRPIEMCLYVAFFFETRELLPS